MKQLNCKNDHPHKLAPRSATVCSANHYSSSALPGLIDPGLPIYNMSNICSSTSAESSTVGSSSTAPTSAPSQQPIHHNTARNQDIIKVKLPCSGDRDAISLKFKRSCSDDVSHSDPLQYSICDHDHDQYEQAARSFYGISRLQQCSNIREKVGADVVCSMCGDEGIAELLFLCSKCFHRPQHIYCSRSYPDLCDEASICNWCLHEENSSTISVPKEGSKEVVCSETNADTKAGEVQHANFNYGCTNGNEKHQIKEEDHNHFEAHNLNADEASLKVDGTKEVSVNIKGHGKAFEYLLMIAAESLPQVLCEAHAEIKQDFHSTACTMINISATDAKIMGSRQMKELDHGKLDTDTLEINNRTANLGASGNQHNMMINANANSRDGVNLKLVGSSQETVKMDIVDQMGTARMGECGAVFGGHIPRRQRCAAPSKAGMSTASTLKYRKKGVQLSPSRNYRRYKLLADVVC